jgi:hypothetical protein
LKRRQGDEVKRRRSREESPSQEDERDGPQVKNCIHPTSKPKPKNFLEAIFTKCLTLPNNLENHINL